MLELMKEAAELGVPDAQEFVGEFYEKGYGVVDADWAQAAEWFEKEAALGEEHAQAWLDAHRENGGE